MIALNVDGKTPCEPRTSWPPPLPNGKSAAVRSLLTPRGGVNAVAPESGPPGDSVLRVRLSVPAAKWQLAHAVTPSLPACMSQNRALPSRIATSWFARLT